MYLPHAGQYEGMNICFRLLVDHLQQTAFRAGGSSFRLVQLLWYEQARGVWGHAPPGKFFELGTLRSLHFSFVTTKGFVIIVCQPDKCFPSRLHRVPQVVQTIKLVMIQCYKWCKD